VSPFHKKGIRSHNICSDVHTTLNLQVPLRGKVVMNVIYLSCSTGMLTMICVSHFM
jgi:hypothetical protein